MNRLLLLASSLLLLVLTTALVAPRFIDWSTYTVVIEEQASRLLGREVHVSGDVDLRLLPMPRITFTDIEIAEDREGGQPGFRAQRIEALMALAPFLSGDTHIVELTLDKPVVRLAALSDGIADLAGDTSNAGTVRIDEARIIDGRIERLAPDGSAHVLLDSLNANLSAPSLLGPWRVDPASAIVDGQRVSLRVNTGAYAGDRRMRMRVVVLPIARPMEIAFDGHLDWSGEEAIFDGRGQARSLDQAIAETDPGTPNGTDNPQLTWRMAADVMAGLENLQAEAIEITLGQAQDQAFVLTGRAGLGLGADPAFNAEIASRQVDLDRMLGGGAAEPVDIAAGWQAAGAFVRWVDRFTIPGDVDFDIPAIVLGGSVIRDIGFEATYRPGLPIALNDLQATFPGETRLGFTGAVAAVGPIEGTDLAVDGVMTLESAAPDLFVGWSTGRRDEGGTFSQLSSIDLSGRIIAQPGDVVVERLRGDIDGSALNGELQYRDVAGRGGQMDLALSAGRFDFALLSGLGRWLTDFRAGATEAPTLSEVSADLSIGELVAGSENLGEVKVSLASNADRVTLDELSIGDAVGARVAASGFFERGTFPPLGEIQISGNMERLGGLARLSRDVFGDHPVLVDLARNSRLYEPAMLAGAYSHRVDQGLSVEVSGQIGGTDVELFAAMPAVDGEPLTGGSQSYFGRDYEFRVDAQSDDAFVMVGQMGLAVLPSDLQGPGSFGASLVGRSEADPSFRIAFDGLETAIRLQGSLRPGEDGAVAQVLGDGSAFAGDVAQLALMAGMATPGLFQPISGSTRFDIDHNVETKQTRLSALTGSFAEVDLRGHAHIDQNGTTPSLELDLALSALDFPLLLAGFLGPTAFDQGFSPTWPEGPIGFNPIPLETSLTLTAPRVRLWDDLTILNGTVQLDADGSRLVVDDLSGEVLGGNLAARLVLRDADPGAIAQGRVSLREADASRFSWQRQGQPIVSGDFSTNFSFESAGTSVSTLLAGLTGDGTLALANSEVSGLSLNGFSRILQASDAGLLDENSDLVQAFADALGAGTMQIEQADTPFSLVGGVAQISNLYIEGQSTALRGGLTADLANLVLDADLSFAAIDGPGDVETMPNIGLSFEGPLTSPARQIDVSQVSSFLGVRQLEQEIRRVEALNAEILERERLLRTMAAVDLDREREAFVRAEQEREVREREEAERRARQEAEERAAALAAEQERERALREALLAREREQLNPDTPSALDLTLPPLEPVIVPSNPLELGENPPPATSAPLDLTPR